MGLDSASMGALIGVCGVCIGAGLNHYFASKQNREKIRLEIVWSREVETILKLRELVSSAVQVISNNPEKEGLRVILSALRCEVPKFNYLPSLFKVLTIFEHRAGICFNGIQERGIAGSSSENRTKVTNDVVLSYNDVLKEINSLLKNTGQSPSFFATVIEVISESVRKKME